MKGLLERIKWDIKNSQVTDQDEIWLDSNDCEYLSAIASREIYYTEEELVSYWQPQERALYFKNIITGWLKALIEQLKILLSHSVNVLLCLTDSLFSQISLLFGLCSSQSSTIFSAFFGTSLSRVPNL